MFRLKGVFRPVDNDNKRRKNMGLIRAALSAATGNLADQWKEFFYCDSMDRNVLMTKGTKKTSGFSSNTTVPALQ